MTSSPERKEAIRWLDRIHGLDLPARFRIMNVCGGHERALTMAGLRTVAQQAWIDARRTDDFAHFAPHLRQILAVNRAMAEAIGYDRHPYDAMLLRYEPGMTAARLAQLFDELKAGILPLLRAIVDQDDAVPYSFLMHDYPAGKQAAFGLEIAAAFGYDLQRGRLDETVHPFEISFTREDVRITTRYRTDYLPAALFGIFHETGHALYEQGVDPALTRSALTTDFLGLYAVGGASFGAHESQSRLWENQVGRSAAFWAHHFPRLREFFPAQLAGVSWEQFHRAVNRVQPSLIRVEADEVTYNLHIMLRAEIEMAMLAGELEVEDLPAVWNQKMQEYVGIVPDRDSQGVLQDIHWSSGYIGSFPTYTIGNIMAAQFFQAARAAAPALDDSLAHGEYGPLRRWLTEHVYRHGRAYAPDELLQRATGARLNTGPYLQYLREKFGALYGV